MIKFVSVLFRFLIEFFCDCWNFLRLAGTFVSANAASYIEETVSDGYPYTVSSVLQLMDDPTVGAQKVGLRFNGLTVPRQASIAYANVQFTCNSPSWDPASIRIYADVSLSNDKSFLN
jgi:hypothetical protein